MKNIYMYNVVFLIVLSGFIFTACDGPSPTKFDDINPADTDPPVLQSILPEKAFLKDTVTVTGTGFDSNPLYNTIKFGTKQGIIISATENELMAIVPEGSGETVKVSVAVKGSVYWSSGIDFTFENTLSVLDEEIVHPCGVAVDNNGNVYIGGRGDGSIFKITPSGEKSVFVEGIPVNGAIHMGPDNYLYVCEQDEGKIVRITLDGQTIEDYAFANSPIDFDWDNNGVLYVVANWEGIYRGDASGPLDYVVENGDIKTIRIFENSVYVGEGWMNRGLKYDITTSGLENEQVIIEKESLILGLEIDINGQIYYGIYGDETLYYVDADGVEGSLYSGKLTSPMRFMDFYDKSIYIVNTGDGDAGVVIKAYIGVKQAPRYGVN